jgi:capsular polysaccharide export protein
MQRVPDPDPDRRTQGAGRTSAWVCTPGLLSLPFLETFLPDYRPTVLPGPDTRAVLGWGQRRSGWAGRGWARMTGQPYVSLEDGFLRSIGLGEQGAVGLGLIVDPVGVYYDARRPSSLETALIDAPDWCDAPMRARAARLVARIVETGLSKTNLGEPLNRFVLQDRRRVLIIDQTSGDASIAGGLAGPDAFTAMLAAARVEEPDAQLIVKRHPAVAAGLKQSCLAGADLRDVTVIDQQVTPASLLAEVDVVYTVTSGLGFEALMRGLPVRCHGLPFYAGWGLTEDVQASSRRGVARDLETLAAAALIREARYVDPIRNRPCTAEEAVERLLTLRDRASRVAGYWAGIGFAPAKQTAVRRLMNGPTSRLSYFDSPSRAVSAAAAESGRLLIWAGKETAAASVAAAGFSGPVVRMEDGFIRSRGLGSNFVPASSVALDDLGIYYDPSRPSRLETLIETQDPTPGDLQRAAALRRRIVEAGISKYNQGGPPPPPPPTPPLPPPPCRRSRPAGRPSSWSDRSRTIVRSCSAAPASARTPASLKPCAKTIRTPS